MNPSNDNGGNPTASSSNRRRLFVANYDSSAFVLSAGSVLFRTHPETHQLQVCLVYNRKNGYWILPKGRKDQGEPMHITAVRETYEETGYPCVLHPCNMPTRSPPPGVELHPSAVLEAENICEPFAMTVRELKCGSLKTIWWFITWLKDNNAEKVVGTQMSSEQSYESSFRDIEAALQIMDATAFQEVLAKAVEIVQKSRESRPDHPHRL
ncbi:hypothetical protein FA15DRAFT_194021 [Coprinopsis marcescibilis]|uniref:Nudix hydrolase domain-containing protein n=1 Tax=Coprinopsis marcescibilis TaxID=230819 RepID=A0A5C3LBR0_COPMA|nr:hypothetical protein FA15DRAFT_194021 [Coprinopsis marcescibilis]